MRQWKHRNYYRSSGEVFSIFNRGKITLNLLSIEVLLVIAFTSSLLLKVRYVLLLNCGEFLSFSKYFDTVEIVYNEHEDRAEIARYNRFSL